MVLHLVVVQVQENGTEGDYAAGNEYREGGNLIRRPRTASSS